MHTSVAQNYIIVDVSALKILYCPTRSLSYLAAAVCQHCLSSVAGGHEVFPSESVFLVPVLLFTWFLSCRSAWRSCREPLLAARRSAFGPCPREGLPGSWSGGKELLPGPTAGAHTGTRGDGAAMQNAAVSPEQRRGPRRRRRCRLGLRTTASAPPEAVWW